MKKKFKLKTYSDLWPCIPTRNFDWEEEEETKRVIIIRPKYLFKPAKKFIVPLLKKKYFRIKLDELGSVVWKNCDGKNTVDNLAKILISTFGAELKEPYERLAKFIMQLGHQKFLEINCPVVNEQEE